MNKFISLLLLFVSLTAFAKDDKAEKPQLTAEQRAAVLKLQRDWLNASVIAAPYDFATESAKQSMLQKYADVTKDLGVDPQKWQFNATTLEYEAVPEQAKNAPKSAPPTASK